jgi:hypothetical protein
MDLPRLWGGGILLSRCRRCGSFKAVGKVRTMSPKFKEYLLFVQNKDSNDPQEGFSKMFDMCMGCILEFEAWAQGKDKRGGGQAALG